MTGRQDMRAPPWQDGGEGGTSSMVRFIADLLGGVTLIPPTIAAELATRGLVGIEPSPASTHLLSAALSWIARLADLASIIHASVSDIHLLEAEAGYDVSHSEPRWRRTIFVSIPERSDSIGALRLAESVVHEAMHLHLTNREQQTQFVMPGDGTMRSPWRDELRPFQGLLHGLYVFSCLTYFFRELMTDQAVDVAGRAHLTQRLRDIEDEVQSIDFVTLAGGLTNAGIALAEQCIGIATNRFAVDGSASTGGRADARQTILRGRIGA